MKKTLKVLFAISVLIGTLTACNLMVGQGVGYVPAQPETLGPEGASELENNPQPELEIEDAFSDNNEFVLSISLASEELLSRFDYLHEVDYTLLRQAGAGNIEHFNGDRLAIWANVPLYDFALISITSDFINDELIFTPTDTFGKVEELLPGQAFVINSYVELGTFSASGVSFAVESGERYYFRMMADQSVGTYPNPFIDTDFVDWFEDGSLTMEVTRDGRESQYFTVTLDEIGDTDPVDWFVENRHLWFLFILSEFENSAN